ncbi:ankyrin repeat-containing protein At5g02620-like [Argentina anserina]|uniref:ankyrin repeat-containing protein At5g02620-like n=1 Tax=Argentina anserina TaxID=57926 RepID=UPI0021763840|nr:ankyrin repeat-containing protein At5g02620-like [Potentilla anserina]
MALPDREMTQLTLDVDQSPTTVAARTTYLRTGGNQSSATRTMSTPHERSTEESNLDYYLPLYHAASRGNWEDARRFLEHDPNAVKAKISNLSMTALHVAACEGHSEFVEKVVKLMPADELAAHDEMGFTALHYAAIGANLRSAKALLKENPKLAQSVDTIGKTPLHLAASFASECKELVWYLLLVTTDEEPGHPFTGPWAANLMNVLIASGFHDIALYLLQQYPNLATVTDQEDCTPLYVLANNQSNFLSGSRLGFWESCFYPSIPIDADYRPPNSVRTYVGSHHDSVQNLNRMSTPVQHGALHWLRRLLCGALKQIAPSGFMTLQDAKLRHHCAEELVKQFCLELSRSNNMSWRLNYILNSEILNIAALNGITEIISKLLEFFPDLIWARLSNNQYLLLPCAIELRHEKVFRLVCDHTARSKLMAIELLESSTILHLAAKLAPPAQLTSVCGAALQMQRELQWFKVVENLVHPYYKQSRNAAKQTARELFTKEHENLADKGEKWLKDTSNSCMVVATLIATVVFAAAFTVPGGNDEADGNPNFLMKKPFIFMVFLVSDAVALFSSLTSVLMFLSILTARFAEEDFIDSLPKRLIIGLAALFFAIAATMVAFGATISIVLSKRFSWVSIPITLLASFPVTLFALLQLPLFIQMVRSTFGNSILF